MIESISYVTGTSIVVVCNDTFRQCAYGICCNYNSAKLCNVSNSVMPSIVVDKVGVNKYKIVSFS